MYSAVFTYLIGQKNASDSNVAVEIDSSLEKTHSFRDRAEHVAINDVASVNDIWQDEVFANIGISLQIGGRR